MTVPRKAWPRLELDEPLSIDLDNKVDTLFDRRRFAKDVNYEALLPALRLATKLLRSQGSLIFYHTIFHKKVERKYYPPGSGLEKKVYVIVHPPETLRKKQCSRVRKALRALANVITYKYGPTEPGALAMTCPADDDARVSVSAVCKDFYGLPSTVLFGDEPYRDILKNFGVEDRPDVTRELVYDHIMFANVICHELAHAAAIFRWGPHKKERTIGDNVMAESGFDWETAVWGGHLVLGEQGRSQFLKDWPSPCEVFSYLRSRGRITVCGESESAGRSWVLPPRWLLQICHKSYWDKVVSRKGRAALEAPRVVGVRRKPAQCKCSTCLTCLQWDGTNLIKTAKSWIEPRSPSCKVGTDNFWKPTLDETDPLECVPKGYALLETGYLIPERLIHKVKQRRITGNRSIDSVQSEQAKE
ncbi:hypothetical protein LTR17_000060 [Elasticomyces elasticus]|nr:hypothetical protein LTR17_000060 [Elasticomyces elasticus]